MKQWLAALALMVTPVMNVWGEGGTSSGGGNALPGSSADDVRSAITQLHPKGLRLALTNLYFLKDAAPSPKDNQFFDLLAKFYTGADFQHSEVMAVLKKTKLSVLDAGSCLDPFGSEADASWIEDQQGLTICYSVPRLTRFSAADLPNQLLALTIHELAHHFGYGEADSVGIQKNLFERLKDVCSINLTLKEDPAALRYPRALRFEYPTYFSLNRPAEMIYEAKYQYNAGLLRLWTAPRKLESFS